MANVSLLLCINLFRGEGNSLVPLPELAGHHPRMSMKRFYKLQAVNYAVAFSGLGYSQMDPFSSRKGNR